MNATILNKTLIAIALTAALSACGGGGDDYTSRYTGDGVDITCTTNVSPGGTIVNTDCRDTKRGGDLPEPDFSVEPSPSNGKPVGGRDPEVDTGNDPSAPIQEQDSYTPPSSYIPTEYGGELDEYGPGECERLKPWHPQPAPGDCDYTVDEYGMVP